MLQEPLNGSNLSEKYSDSIYSGRPQYGNIAGNPNPYGESPYGNTYPGPNTMNYPYAQNSPNPPMALQIESRPNDPLSHLDDGLAGQARKKFIIKVYTILTVQFLLTAALCFISIYVPGFLLFQYFNQWLMWVCLALIILTEICIFCLPAGRKHPINLILLFIFTLSQAYIISYICSLVTFQQGGNVVIVAALMTFAVVFALTMYAIFTPTDFTIKWGIIIVIIVNILMFLVFLLLIFRFSFLQNFYCFLAVTLFGTYLVIDTQLIIGGRRLQISMDDYVVGALILYMDIIQIFLYLLEILKKK